MQLVRVQYDLITESINKTVEQLVRETWKQVKNSNSKQCEYSLNKIKSGHVVIEFNYETEE